MTLLGLGNSSPQAAMTSSPEQREHLRHEVLETIKGVLPLVVALTAAWLAIDFATHLVT